MMALMPEVPGNLSPNTHIRKAPFSQLITNITFASDLAAYSEVAISLCSYIEHCCPAEVAMYSVVLSI